MSALMLLPYAMLRHVLPAFRHSLLRCDTFTIFDVAAATITCLLRCYFDADISMITLRQIADATEG